MPGPYGFGYHGDPGDFTSVAEAAWCCASVGQFMVIAPNDNRFRIRWSAIGDATDWTTVDSSDARTKQSSDQFFPAQFGTVTGIAGTDFNAYVFQERASWSMSYQGGDVVFSFDRFEEGRGCYKANRLVSVDEAVFFESQYGYHVVEGNQVTDIGYGAVDKSFTPS